MEYPILAGVLCLAYGGSILLKLWVDARFRAGVAGRKPAERFGGSYENEEYYLPAEEAERRRMSLGQYLVVSGVVILGVGALGAYLFPPANWTLTNSPDGRFQAEFPNPPRVRESSSVTAMGAVTQHEYAVNRLFRVSCSVQYVDLPVARQDGLAGLADQIRDAITTQAGATVLKTTEITTGTVNGQELLLRHPREGVMRIRTYMVENRLYAVAAGGLPPSGNHPDAERFLQSFKFTQ